MFPCHWEDDRQDRIYGDELSGSQGGFDDGRAFAWKPRSVLSPLSPHDGEMGRWGDSPARRHLREIAWVLFFPRSGLRAHY